MDNKLLISIIIPVYNGEKSIADLVDSLILKISAHYLLDIILVNDFSKDNSESVCIKVFNKYPNTVKFYSLAKNVGEHNAVMCGLNMCDGEYAIIIDDDFQNPVSEVLQLSNFLVQNSHDVVYTYYNKKQHSFLRNLGSSFNDKVANLMLKKPKSLYLSSFKGVNRFLINEIIKYDLPFPYIDGLILRTTSNIGKILVEHHKRKEGQSNYTLIKLISLWMNMFTNFSILPLRISIIIGFIFAIFGFVFGVIIIIEHFINANLPIGYASLIVVITLFAGIQLIAIGLIGEYLGRIFMSQNKTPQYSIRKSFEQK